MDWGTLPASLSCTNISPPRSVTTLTGNFWRNWQMNTALFRGHYGVYLKTDTRADGCQISSLNRHFSLKNVLMLQYWHHMPGNATQSDCQLLWCPDLSMANVFRNYYPLLFALFSICFVPIWPGRLLHIGKALWEKPLMCLTYSPCSGQVL